jgi:hypothetical protein
MTTEYSTDTRVLRVAVRVTTDTRPKDLSHVLDAAFEDWDDVVQFTVEGHGWDGGQEPFKETRDE